MTALEAWVARVGAHHEQSLRIQKQAAWAPDESGRYVASMFVGDPQRTDDPVLNRLRRAVSPATTVLDVGGGAGRYALPLALACKEVIVVEPDPGMVRTLREQVARHRTENITIVEEKWQDRARPAGRHRAGRARHLRCRGYQGVRALADGTCARTGLARRQHALAHAGALCVLAAGAWRGAYHAALGARAAAAAVGARRLSQSRDAQRPPT